MEEQTSGIDTSLLFKLKALARRGAVLRRAPAAGGGVVEQVEGQHERRIAKPSLFEPDEITAALAKGWLTEPTPGTLLLSKRGARSLRAALSRSAGETRRGETAGDGHRYAVSSDASGRSLADGPAARRKDGPALRPRLSAHESPLAWLRARGAGRGEELISATEFDAGERLRADFELAQMRPRVTASWDLATPAMRQRRAGPDGGLQMSEATLAARQRVEAALKAVGPEMSGVLIDVCCFLQGMEQAERNGRWPRRSGKVVLKLALAQLARHYGIGGSSGPPRGRVLHWGADGYRPQIDGGPELDRTG